jgi:hypothetical protein
LPICENPEPAKNGQVKNGILSCGNYKKNKIPPRRARIGTAVALKSNVTLSA